MAMHWAMAGDAAGVTQELCDTEFTQDEQAWRRGCSPLMGQVRAAGGSGGPAKPLVVWWLKG